MFDKILSFILDQILDDLWAAIVERQYVGAAAHVAFNLAFIVIVDSDDEATLGSRKRRK